MRPRGAPRAVPLDAGTVSPPLGHTVGMTSWNDALAAEPEVVGRAHAVLTSTTNCVLGTLRSDGSPRLSGIDPFVHDGELWLGSMPGARKGADLRRDPRLALHAVPWESRKTKDGAEDPGEADAKVTGRAVLADAQRTAAVMAWFAEERGMEEAMEADLFTVDVESVVVISVADDLLVIDRWTPGEGRRTVRRS